jgi:hypothetical protein
MLQRPGVRTDIPPYLLRVTLRDLARQKAQWRASKRWSDWLVGHPDILSALKAEVARHAGNIRREFVHSYASGDAVEFVPTPLTRKFAVQLQRQP